MKRFLLLLLLPAIVWPTVPSASAQTAVPHGSVGLIPPVDAPVARHFEAPVSEFGRGHRGLDLRIPAGAPVRAAGAGVVTFAGSVGDVIAVTVDHGNDLVTTYSSLSELLVAAGQIVTTGTRLGHSGTMHPGGDQGLHFGVKRAGVYVDPLEFMAPVDHGSAFTLVPVVPDEVVDTLSDFGISDLTTLTRGCSPRSRVRAAQRPPTENVVVAVAGIGSHTAGEVSAPIYETGPDLLGYPESKTYRFSYRGTEGPDLHEPYDGVDTYGDIDGAADRLRELMRRIAARHPGQKVDLIAHSQGGIVARAYLDSVVRRPDPALPIVENVVTYSSPHGGAPLAGGAEEIADGSVSGRLLLEALSLWARKGGALPDPLARAVSQLAPGSALLRRLDAAPLPFGTRALTIAIPNDVVVPADRADLEGAAHTVVPPAGLNGHDAVVTSASARSAAYSFLAGASDICSGGWDLWGPLVGRAVSGAEALIPELLDAVTGPLG